MTTERLPILPELQDLLPSRMRKLSLLLFSDDCLKTVDLHRKAVAIDADILLSVVLLLVRLL